MADLVSKPLTRKQINYATERCKRIAVKKKADLEDLAQRERLPELTDAARVKMLLDGKVTIDLSRLKLPATPDRYWRCPSVVDCADFSDKEGEISLHNKAVDKALKRAQSATDKRAAAILDRFELGEPSEALRLLTEFEATEFRL